MVKITIDKADTYEDIEIMITCKEINQQVKEVIKQINNVYTSIIAKQDDKTYAVNLNTIYYIEAIDDKIFLYEEDRILECSNRLYELEKQLQDSSFVRISKSCILNIDMLDSVKYLINGKYEAHLLNGEKMIISRHYVSDFKEKFGL
jgi:DNA-binding LytR/AlgR family response regulator